MNDARMPSVLPPRETCVLRYALEHQAAEQPDTEFVRFEFGGAWCYRETLHRAQRLGAALQALGIRQGDHVVAWMPNGREALETFFAINYIGAVHIPINTGYRGALLAHVLENSDARLIIAQAEFVDRLAEVDTAQLETIMVVGDLVVPELAFPALPGLTTIDYHATTRTAGMPAPLDRPIEPWDLQSIVYTSGTTGPSKGVMSSYFHCYNGTNQEAWYCVRAEDRFLVNLPIFHIGGCFIIHAMLCRGGAITISPGFKTDSFWDLVRETKSTAVFLLGVMCTFLVKQPPRDDDREHPLRMVFSVPLSEESVRFPERFGCELYTIFNMTEIATPLISGRNPREPGLAGQARTGFELRVVDDNDIELADGEVGELILRSHLPWALNHGYYKDPEATARAWRNGWFHTGDAFRRDATGNFYFVDRLKDAIRRRGENISSFEVESVVNEHPAVRECAAVPAPSEHGEDEVMVVLAAKLGQTIAPPELLEFLAPRMARFMLPRYVRIMDELPKTPTAKVQKAELRAQGVTADTWDREHWDRNIGDRESANPIQRRRTPS
jgi:crotonobetaine/carnitine-CoA ligase